MPIVQNYRPNRPFILPPSPARSTDSQFNVEEEKAQLSPTPAALTFPFRSTVDSSNDVVRPILRPRRCVATNENGDEQRAENEHDDQQQQQLIASSRGDEEETTTLDHDMNNDSRDMWVIRRCDAFDEDDEDFQEGMSGL